MAKPQTTESTQKNLNLLAIRNGLVILKDGGIRMILKVGSVNFALKSEEEQNGLIQQYQGFLNALKFPIQIVMQSRRLDLYTYLNFLRRTLSTQTEDMLKAQTEDYINYIERLIARANIMDKRFYVAIPLFPSGVVRAGMLDKILGAAKTGEVHYTNDQFKHFQQQLQERANVIISGLGSMGLQTTILNSQEIIELLYTIYNPEEASSERLAQINTLEAPVIQTEEEQVTRLAKDAKKEDTSQPVNLPETPQPPVASPQAATPENMAQVQGAAKAQEAAVGQPVDVQGQQYYSTPQAVQAEAVATPPTPPPAPASMSTPPVAEPTPSAPAPSAQPDSPPPNNPPPPAPTNN